MLGDSADTITKLSGDCVGIVAVVSGDSADTITKLSGDVVDAIAILLAWPLVVLLCSRLFRLLSLHTPAWP